MIKTGLLLFCVALVSCAGAQAAELELHHADFHARVGMKVYAAVGDAALAASGLQATLKGPAGEKTVLDKKGKLDAEEAISLNFRELSKGKYLLNVNLLDQEGKSLKSATREFEKPYDGVPRVGLDENNAICVKGKPFFPVTSWCLSSEADLAKWAPYVNTFQGVGFNPPDWTIEGCRRIMDLAQKHGKMYIGPVRGAYWAKGGPVTGTCWYKDENGKKVQEVTADHEKIAAYVDALKDHPALLLWHWHDEPELGDKVFISPEESRKWAEISHQHDSQHPVKLNNSGGWFSRPLENWAYKRIKTYTYQGNTIPGPRRVTLADVMCQDFYPIAYQNDKPYDNSVEAMCLGMDRMVELNRNLTGFMACVETCDMDLKKPAPAPTPEEIRMLCWANIVHGARGINWFHYFAETPRENLAEMARFLEQITRLTPEVCGPVYTGRITKTEAKGGRVDFMATQTGHTVTLFAVNLKRTPETVTFTLDKAPKRITVVDENRTLEVKDQVFTDSFAPLAVHIYRLDL